MPLKHLHKCYSEPLTNLSAGRLFCGSRHAQQIVTWASPSVPPNVYRVHYSGQSGLDVTLTSPSSDEVKNYWSCTSTPSLSSRCVHQQVYLLVGSNSGPAQFPQPLTPIQSTLSSVYLSAVKPRQCG